MNEIKTVNNNFKEKFDELNQELEKLDIFKDKNNGNKKLIKSKINTSQNSIKFNIENNVEVGYLNKSIYYKFLKYNKCIMVKLNDDFNYKPEEVLEKATDSENKCYSYYNTLRLKIFSRVIAEFYKIMILEFQEKIELLQIKKDSVYSEEDLKKVEEIYKEIVDFLINIYYKYPISGERKTSEEINKYLNTLNIDEEIFELKDKLNMIKDIISMELEKKNIELNKKYEKNREFWNYIFTIIGIALAAIQVLQGVF